MNHFEAINDAVKTIRDYETLMGKPITELEVTQKQYDILKEHASLRYQVQPGDKVHLDTFIGIKIKIKD